METNITFDEYAFMFVHRDTGMDLKTINKDKRIMVCTTADREALARNRLRRKLAKKVSKEE